MCYIKLFVMQENVIRSRHKDRVLRAIPCHLRRNLEEIKKYHKEYEIIKFNNCFLFLVMRSIHISKYTQRQIIISLK